MKTLRSEDNLELARELYEINALRKELEKREKLIKEHFKAMNQVSIKVGPYLILTKEASTSSIDRKELTAEMGEDFVSKYLKTTTYLKLEILKDRAA